MNRGDTFLAGPRHVQLRERLEHGSDKEVFLACVERDGHTAYVVAKFEREPGVLEKEVTRARALERHLIPTAPVLYHGDTSLSGTRCVLRAFVEGSRGDAWPRGKMEPRARLALRALVEQAIARGVYVGHLDPEDAIYVRALASWVIVDSGGIKENVDRVTLRARYREKLLLRWGDAFDV